MGRDRLFDIADRQGGYFTTSQARAVGIPYSNFPRFLASGEWIKEMRGIYRLARYPVTDSPELVVYSLWSCNRKGIVQGVWSHETAMDIHDLSDVMPVKMHMTVPPGFRRRVVIPTILKLHYGLLSETDIEQYPGYRVTTPLRTLVDVAANGTVSPDLIAQGFEQALEKGKLSRSQLNEAPLDQIAPLKRIIHDYEL